MKTLFTFALIGAAAIGVAAQTSPPPPPPAAPPHPGDAAIALDGKMRAEKVYVETIAHSSKIVKNAPFSADAVSESVQTLADGNRIIRTSTTKMFRDSEGRFRREGTANAGGALGVYFNGQTTTISDPVAGFEYFLNDKTKTYRQSSLKAPFAVKLNGYHAAQGAYQVDLEKVKKMQLEAGSIYTTVTPKTLTPQEQKELEEAVKAAKANGAQIFENVTIAKPGQPLPGGVEGELMRAKVLTTASAATGFGSVPASMNMKTESLGKQTIEGVEAEGTRTVTTIPAGEIGNERPIEIVYEKWYSSELQTIIMSKHSDPRYGDQTYRLTNLNRSEPDRSLFNPPADYKVSAQGAFSPMAPLPAMPGFPAVMAVPSVKGFAVPKPAHAPKPVAAPAAPPAAPAPPKEM